MAAKERQQEELLTGKELDRAIVFLFRKVEVPSGGLGYKYLMEAIRLSYEDDTYLHTITSRLYPEIAKKYGAKANNVERAIRHAVEVSFEKGNMEFIDENFTYDRRKGKAKNGEFIADAVMYIKINY